MYQITIFYTLNMHNVKYQSYLNKAGKKKKHHPQIPPGKCNTTLPPSPSVFNEPCIPSPTPTPNSGTHSTSPPPPTILAPTGPLLPFSALQPAVGKITQPQSDELRLASVSPLLLGQTRFSRLPLPLPAHMAGDYPGAQHFVILT